MKNNMKIKQAMLVFTGLCMLSGVFGINGDFGSEHTISNQTKYTVDVQMRRSICPDLSFELKSLESKVISDTLCLVKKIDAQVYTQGKPAGQEAFTKGRVTADPYRSPFSLVGAGGTRSWRVVSNFDTKKEGFKVEEIKETDSWKYDK